jgi:hypothetical protein
MQLYTPSEVPSLIQGRVCRQSRVVAVVGFVLVVLMLGVLPAYIFWTANLSLWILVPIALVDGLLLKWLVTAQFNAFHCENWLLRIAPDGLWINLRSHHNRQFAPARTVLFVPYLEIAGVNSRTVKRVERNNGRTTMWTDQFLDVRLHDAAPPEVATEISEERRRRTAGSHFGGFITSSGRNNHVPVTLPADDLLRLTWRGRFDFVVPSLTKTLGELAAECTVDSPVVEEPVDRQTLSEAEVDRQILERVEHGDTLAAVQLLRDRRGMSLKQAKEFVDELTVRI